MPGQGRLGDKANVPLDAHGCPACPHPAIGPAIQGSPDVNVNRRPALRVDDPGIHAACCGTNTWVATQGSLTVFINGRGAHRMGDQNRHCGGLGQLIEGSPNVVVGESGGGAGGAAGSHVGARSAGKGGIRGGAGAGAGAGTGGAGYGSNVGGTGLGGHNAASASTSRGGSVESARTIEPDEIEVVVVNTSGKPAGNVAFELLFPDGSARIGRTTDDGLIRFDHLTQRGECTLKFPDLEQLPEGRDG
jgi:uncharacterized Zn-binding protein involved in type VI secretion